MLQKSFPLTDKTCFLYGNPQPSHLLIQPVGAQDLSGGLEKEVACLEKNGRRRFSSCGLRDQKLESGAFSLGSPACLGTEAFGNGAAETLDFILRNLLPELKRRFSLSSELPVILGGYSLAGLFPSGPPVRQMFSPVLQLSLPLSGFRTGWSMSFPIL